MTGTDLKRKTAKGLLWGGIGSGAFQLLNLVFGIFLARMLSPSDYGMVGALAIFSATAGLLSESGFTLAIVNRADLTNRELNSVFWFNVVAGIFIYALLFSVSPLIARFYELPQITRLARFMFLTCLSGGLATVPAALLFRDLKVKQRTQMMTVSVILSGSVGLVCAYHGLGYWGLAWQTVVYSMSYSSLLWIVCRWRPSFEFDINALKSMLPFSMRQLITTLFTNINNNFFAMLMARIYGMRPAGFYTQGNKWVAMGFNMVSLTVNSVGQPVFRQAAGDHERLRRIFRKILRFTVFVSFPALWGLALIAPELITITVTDKWAECVPVMRILCIWGAFMPVSTLYGNLFNAINRPDIFMWSSISLGILQILCAICSSPLGMNAMLLIFSAINILWLLVWQHSASRCIGLRLSDVLKDILPYLLISGAVMAAVYLVSLPINDVYLSLITKIALAAVSYILIMWILKPEQLKETIDYFKNKKVAK